MIIVIIAIHFLYSKSLDHLSCVWVNSPRQIQPWINFHRKRDYRFVFRLSDPVKNSQII